MPSIFNRLHRALADRRGATRISGRYAVELIVGVTAGGSPATIFSHSLDVAAGRGVHKPIDMPGPQEQCAR